MWIDLCCIDETIRNDIEKLVIKKLLPACRYGDIYIVSNILEHTDIDINKSYKYGEYFYDDEYSTDEDFTLLMLSVCFEQFDIFEFLLKNKKLDVNAQDQWGQNALIYTCVRCTYKFASKLIERNDIKLNLKDCDGCTALMNVCDNVNLEIVKELLYWSDTDVFLKDNKGRVAIDHAKDKKIHDFLKDDMMSHFDFLPVPDDVLRHIMDFY